MQALSLRFQLSLSHFIISLIIALCCGLFVFHIMYPSPFYQLLGVGSIFLIIIGVDVVCGPLLTLLLANPNKPPSELGLDISLIAMVQIAALAFGLHTVYIARPVVLAFETDRFTVVPATEILTDHLKDAPKELQTLPALGVRVIGTKKHNSNEEFFELTELSASGISPGMHPKWWTQYSDNHDLVNERSKAISLLIEQRPESTPAIQKAMQKTGLTADKLRFLPLTYQYSHDWSVLIDKKNNIVAYVPVNGFLNP